MFEGLNSSDVFTLPHMQSDDWCPLPNAADPGLDLSHVHCSNGYAAITQSINHTVDIVMN
jgi:hypothetical protein